MRCLLILFVAAILGFGRPAAAQAQQTDEKVPDGRNWAALLGLDRPAAQARYDDERTQEGWAWARIKRDEVADLNLRCDPAGKARLDSRADAGWDDACRKITASFISDVLTLPRWRDRIARHGLRLRGARIDGDLDLVNAEIRSDLWIDASRIEGKLDLTGAHLAGVLSLQRTMLHGDLAAERVRADAGLLLQDHAAFRGDVILSSARIAGHVLMDSSSVDGTVDASGLSVEGGVFLRNRATVKRGLDLRGARLGGLEMDGSSFAGDVNAYHLSVERNLFLGDRATFAGRVILSSASVAGDVDMDSSTFGGTVNADSLSVGGNLSLRDGARFERDVIFSGARVRGQVEMDGSAFAAAVTAADLSVGGNLFLRGGATFTADVGLPGAKVGGNVEVRRATFLRNFDAGDLSVGGDLFLSDGASFGGTVSLAGARVGGAVTLAGAGFGAAVDAYGASVGRWMYANDARFAQTFGLNALHVAGGLDLRGAIANRIDLTNAVIGDGLILGDADRPLEWRCTGFQPGQVGNGTLPASTGWPLGDRRWQTTRCGTGGDSRVPMIVLRNTRAGVLEDDQRSWPPEVDLDGFTYDRLGSSGGSGAADMRQRSAGEWRDWLDRDRRFSTQPYTQLATVLLGSGQRGIAESILYDARERERREALGRGDWAMGIWLTVLWAAAGYGAGLYTFRILIWLGGLTFLGAVVLLSAAQARRRGVLWCLSASLQLLLPVITFNKSARDFFANKPPVNSWEKRNLSAWQAALLSALALASLVLGFILLAALAYPTPKG